MCKDIKGLSLIEIVTAIFVLSFAILSVASIFPAGLEMNRKTKMRIEALEAAVGVMEAMKDLPYYDPNNLDLLELAGNSNTPFSIGFPITGYPNGGYPKVLLDASGTYKYSSPESPIFFRGATGDDPRGLAPIKDSSFSAIRFEPVVTDTTNRYTDTYGSAMAKRSRIYRIIVTVNIEEAVKGQFVYSYIRVVSYRGDSLTVLPGE